MSNVVRKDRNELPSEELVKKLTVLELWSLGYSIEAITKASELILDRETDK